MGKIRSLVELPCEEAFHVVASHWRMRDPRGVDAVASPFASLFPRPNNSYEEKEILV